ncbi:MAG: fibrillarin-like rRNA/tRNA 2'-O-methyltransferase [archaeon]|nr:fibrillarin-like rRNA/tRNA 2'-O-methyltransferase [archaeon]
MKPHEILNGVYQLENMIATENMVPGKAVYGEKLFAANGKEYRAWNPNRSKVGAAIKKGLRELGITKASTILYLGAAEGTTISHLSDIVGKEGAIFGVDISARSMRKFVYLCEQRENLIPILGDASNPNSYKEHIKTFSCDALFQDVSQKNQAEIFLKNSRLYLKGAGHAFLSVKARSISVSEKTEKVVEDEMRKLKNEFEIRAVYSLHPYEKDHAMVHCQKK